MKNWDEFVDENEKCACGSTNLVLACGPRSNDMLIIGEFPGEDEIKSGKPFSGATGGVFREELRKVGIPMSGFRVCNLWLHLPNKKKECLEFGFKQCIAEAADKKVVILVGSEVVKQFCDLPVSEVTGLKVESAYLSAPLVIACIQPASVFRGTVGELRLSLKKIAKLIGEQDEKKT